MVELIHGLSAETVRANLARVRERIGDAGRDPDEIEILAAVKYVPVDELSVLADAGVTLVGENRAQDLTEKAAATPGRFTWDFIGHLQSRKVRDVLPRVRYIQSVASDSVLAQLAATPRPTPRSSSRSTWRGSRVRAGWRRPSWGPSSSAVPCTSSG